ncbi:hypothetical protein MYCTH_2136757 [Thermothelomyces thermophilus ATCC 42464]|uniref:BHLH domain-containing protein n=1 Tax=Thermothelomyces thermophilus (strain ATCC 42464 / BCRC 31852 / DSM 1799) TaxID=573729 RepID=G2Q5F1_THET4|nr:uncharacterized protein MYCTH_2136757 [Thermothelomyces thermophilus ATCC 42464]AEO53782.1 hypothetical protein MYCTH_2136757 [Thermothelomyces thermophilus ATCC 42464]
MDHDRAWPANGSSEGLDGLHDSMLATGLVAQPLAHSRNNPESSQPGPWTTGTVPACSPRFGGLFVQTQQQGAIHPYGLPSPAPTAPVASPPDWPNHDTSCVVGAWPVSPISPSPTVGEAVGVELNHNLLYQPHSAQAAHALFDVGFRDWVGNANFHLDLHNTYSAAPTVSSLPHAVPPNVGSAWPGHLPTTTLDNGELPETTAFGHTITRERGCGPTLRTATRRVKRPAPAPRPGESAAHQRARANHNLVEQHYRHRLHARFEALLDSLPEGILNDDDDDDDDDQAVRGDPRGGTGGDATVAARGSGGWDINDDQQTGALATGVGGRGGGDGGGIKGRNNRRMSKVDVLTKADRVIKFLEGDIQRMRWEMEEMKRQREVAFRRVAPMETGVEVRGNCEWNMEGR